MIGSTSAYIGRKFDEVVMRFVDVFMKPFLIAAIVITTILGRGLDKVIVPWSSSWTSYACKSRQCAPVKQEYVMAAGLGGSASEDSDRHILPNTIFLSNSGFYE